MENELFLKKSMASEDMQNVIDEISERIGTLEKEMTTKFHSGYLDVIKKCSVLEQLREDVEEMKANSIELLYEAEDVQLKQTSLYSEYDGIQLAMDRLRKVQRGFGLLQEFLSQAAMLEKSNSIYESVCGLRKISELKGEFKKYNFYRVIKECYEGCKERFMGALEDEVSGWLDRLDFVSLGKSIEIGHSHRIFDEVSSLKRAVMDTDILKAIYASKRLEVEKRIVELLDRKREMILVRMFGNESRIGDKNDILYFAISFILISHFLTEYFPSARSFCMEVLDMVYHYEFEDISTIAILKRALLTTGLESERFNEIVEKTAFRYLEQKIDKSQFVDNIKVFVRKTGRVLAQLSGFSTELDELFAKKVDEHLERYLGTFNEDEKDRDKRYTEIQREINSVIDELVDIKPTVSDFNFNVLDKIDETNGRYVDEKYGDVVERIRHATDVDKIVRIILSLREFMNDKCRLSLVLRIDKNISEILSHRKEDDVELVKDTIRRNFLEG